MDDDELLAISDRLTRGEVRPADALALANEVVSLLREREEQKRNDLRTEPAGATHALLLDAVHVVRDVGASPRLTPEADNSHQYALMAMARWASNVQAFAVLMKAGLPTEAYGVARMGSELAINACWIAQGRATEDEFPTREKRATALVLDARYSTKVWFEEMRCRFSRGRDPLVRFYSRAFPPLG